MWAKNKTKQESYVVPDWASGFKVKPTSRLKLANIPTPIQYWDLSGLPEGFSVFIKRDDMTGSTLSGNKIRKLEFILSDAIDKGYTDVITYGNSQSNHVRTTALAAKEVGLEAHCVSRCMDQDAHGQFEEGNLFFTKLSGCNAYFLMISEDMAERGGNECFNQVIQHIRDTTGRDCYKIPIGGSDILGMFGYLDAYRELLEQGITDCVTDIVVTTTTGGTLAGLAIANYLVNKDRIRMHGYCPAIDLNHEHTNECLQAVGLTDVRSEDIMQLTNCRGLGYGLNTPEELGFITDVCQQTGVVLDTSYTGKAAYMMVQDLINNPNKFKGKEILFIHTGGINVNLTRGKSTEFHNIETKQVWKTWKIQP